MLTACKLNENEFPQLKRFYLEVISGTPTMSRFGRWIYGLHPTDEMLLNFIRGGCAYLFYDGERPVSAAALTLSQGPEYHGVPWKADLRDNEVAVVHLLCVHPAYQGCGYARQTMEFLTAIAAKAGKKALCFDALRGNTPARSLYESMGYSPIAVRAMDTANAGRTDFVLYERLL